MYRIKCPGVGGCESGCKNGITIKLQSDVLLNPALKLDEAMLEQ